MADRYYILVWIEVHTYMVKNKKSETDRGVSFLLCHLVAITLLLSCYSSSASYSLPLSSSYNSAQQAKGQKSTTELIPVFTHGLVQQYHAQIPITTRNYILYKNPTYGIVIQYPADWKRIEYYNTPATISGSNLIVNFLAPLVNTSGHWRAHLMVQVLKHDQAKKLVPQNQITIGDRQGFKSLHNSSMQIYNLDRNTDSTVHVKAMDIWFTSNNGDTYLLTYKAATAEYQDYIPTIQKMIDSFRIENSKVVNSTATHLKSG
jgi:hypothetical protein